MAALHVLYYKNSLTKVVEAAFWDGGLFLIEVEDSAWRKRNGTCGEEVISEQERMYYRIR
ncbi:MAG: hypothetical protein AAF587_22615 [Bacteroidota bacterium]